MYAYVYMYDLYPCDFIHLRMHCVSVSILTFVLNTYCSTKQITVYSK